MSLITNHSQFILIELDAEIEYVILTYLSIKDLPSAARVSKAWHYIISQQPFQDEIFLQDPSREKYFIKALKKYQYDRIHYWISLGISEKVNGDVVQAASLISYGGKFKYPPIVSIAAHVLRGQKGADVVLSLVSLHANPFAETVYYSYDTVANKVRYGPPSYFACDDGIKALLLLAEIEKILEELKKLEELEESVRLSGIAQAQLSDLLDKILHSKIKIFNHLLSCGDLRITILKEYLDRLMQQQEFPVKGISRILTVEDKQMLIAIDNFQQLYQNISNLTSIQKFFLKYDPFIEATFTVFIPFACVLFVLALTLPIAGAFFPALLPLLTNITTVVTIIAPIVSIMGGADYQQFRNSSHISLSNVDKKQPEEKKEMLLLRGGLFFKSLKPRVHEHIARCNKGVSISSESKNSSLITKTYIPLKANGRSISTSSNDYISDISLDNRDESLKKAMHSHP